MKQLQRIKRIFASALTLALVLTLVNPAPVLAEESAAPAEKTGDKVWLHVVNGSFQGKYGSDDISNAPSVEVTLDADRTLPAEVKEITATRTNGTFDGWYTRSAREVLQKQGEDEAYSVWHTAKKNGVEVEPGSGKVPEGVNVLYAVFDDKAEAEPEDKLVEFYLDWNGINGMYGNCLTCIRSYNGGEVYFTTDDAAVYSLNFSSDYEKKFEAAGKTWKSLKDIWAENTFNGYKFKGWSEERHGSPVWEDTPIKNGMTFYAQWEKDGLSSDSFDPPADPDAGPLEFIRIVGDGLGASLSTSRHASEGASITLNMIGSPIHAQAEEVTWNLTIGKGSFKTETISVSAGDMKVYDEGGLEIRAEGNSLIITDIEGREYGITVGVTAKSTEGTAISAPANASVGFAHNWDQGVKKGEPTCTEGAEILYTCTADGCNTTKTTKVSPLGHVYEKGSDNDNCRVIVKEATCTTDGEKQFKCLRCGEVNKTLVKIPALGHDWEITSEMPVSCNKNEITKTCRRAGCTAQETSLVPASNPELHEWTETERYHTTCMSDIVYERCPVCGATRHYTAAADNPDCHSYAYESRMVVDCTHVEYTFKCVHGCGSVMTMLKSETNHVWGNWKTTTAPTTAAPGEQTRECSRCHEKETRTVPQLSVGKLPGGDNQFGQKTPAAETKPDNDNAASVTKVAADSAAAKVQTAKTNTNTAPASASAGSAKVKAQTANDDKAAAADTDTKESTAVKTGWQKISGKKCYIGSNGVKKTGWQTIKGKKYYFDKNGAMKTGWQKIKGKKYYFDKNGVMKTGWQKIQGKKYYFDKNGVMKTGWQKIKGKKYYFNAKGVMQANGLKTIKGKKYYFDKNGAMKTGKVKIKGKTYIFKSNGVLKKKV